MRVQTLIAFSRGYVDRHQHLEVRDAARRGDAVSVQLYLENQRCVRQHPACVHGLHVVPTHCLLDLFDCCLHWAILLGYQLPLQTNLG